MVAVYLSCFIFGGILVGFNLLAGGRGGSSGDAGDGGGDPGDGDAGEAGDGANGDLESTGGMTDVDSSGAGEGFVEAAGVAGDADSDGPDVDAPDGQMPFHGSALPSPIGMAGLPAGDAIATRSAGPALLSLRNLSMFTAGFGAAGLLVGLTGASDAVTAACAATAGTAAAGAAWGIHAYLIRTQSGEVGDGSELVGRSATVLVAVGKNRKGRVSVHAPDGTIPMTAVVASYSSRDRFSEGERVMIVETNGPGGAVLVSPEDDLGV